MLDALADYARIFRAALAMARHDVLLPDAYRSRMPLPAKLFGSLLRLGATKAGDRPAVRLAKALQQLGPAWIKLGQLLATRPDVIGMQAAQDLSHLKDALPPFSMDQARQALKDEFGEDAARLFPALTPPVAAASIAQVHRMETPDGPRAVKILRPDVERKIQRELRAMRRIARLAERHGGPEARRMEPVKFVETMAQSLSRELDLRFEAGAASEFAEIAAVDGYFHVPKVDWERTGLKVLTTEWIDGKPLTRPDALDGHDRAEMANRINRGFLASALDHGCFHADLHEGNMIMARDGRLFLVDFGIMGRIGPNERLFLAQILDGFLKRDYARVSQVHFEAGYVPASHSMEDFAQALRSVGEPIFGKSAADVSMARVLIQLLDITRQFGMHLRPELVLLQKTMVQVEGVARATDTRHDIWAAAKPIVDRWVRREFGPPGLRQKAEDGARDLWRRLGRLPDTLDALEAAIRRQAETQPVQAPRSRALPGWAWALAGMLIGAAGAWAAIARPWLAG